MQYFVTDTKVDMIILVFLSFPFFPLSQFRVLYLVFSAGEPSLLFLDSSIRSIAALVIFSVVF